ncbi:MAG: hypothetical protein QM205_03810 [Bacillota bacterium]|jgi:hypothetical protein|nr:hypothetical protein [Bacillota bacterium]
MLKELINAKVEMDVALGVRTPGGASAPKKYVGTLLEVDEKFVKLELVNCRRADKVILISRKFIVTVRRA